MEWLARSVYSRNSMCSHHSKSIHSLLFSRWKWIQYFFFPFSLYYSFILHIMHQKNICNLGSFFIPLILIVFIYFKIFITQKKVADKRQNIKTAGAKTGQNGAKKKNNNKVWNWIKLLLPGLLDKHCFSLNSHSHF